MSSTSKVSDHRRKWDAEEYERMATERLQQELEAQERAGQKLPAIKRDYLRQRDYKVDLDSKLGKSVVITKNTPSSQTGGYYCNVCDCIVKDSINFLDHINGKKHQRNLGMSMRVERSSLDQVKRRFEMNKKRLEEKKRDYDLEQRMKEIQEEEDKLKEYRREKKKEKKRKLEEADEEPRKGTTELASIMGFSGFGGSKKSK
uniref:Putative u1-like zn-finger protein n=2 Tax=Panstrongylus TaxID=65342 RepID=A0A224XPQ6_9HEMI